MIRRCALACAAAVLLPLHRAHAADTLFVVPGSHLDLGYTAPLSVVRDERVHIIDLAIADAERDPGFVWFEEGGWSVEAWLDHYHADFARIALLRSLVMSGRIGVGATLLSAHGAAFPAALHLLTMHLDRIERELGRRPVVAVLNDVPSAPEALVDALAAAGIHYLLAAPNQTFTAPLPATLVQRPFYWESSRGARVLTYIDPDGYMSGAARWGLPPQCARAFNPRLFPRDASDAQVLAAGAGQEFAHRAGALPIDIVQDSYDNWEPDCAEQLPATVRQWNAGHRDEQIVLATPERYFRQLERRFGSRLPVRRGEWGGDWDRLRATEPVWSWRLRRAMGAVTATTPYAARLALATVLDHNVGLGPRWAGNVSAAIAMQHVHEVAALYHDAVSGVLGAAGVNAVPPPLAAPAARQWPAAWSPLVGARDGVARVRIGPGFPHARVDDSLVIVPSDVRVAADPARLLASVRLDRPALEARAGDHFRAVLEIRLAVPRDSVRIAPASVADAIDNHWLRGAAPATIVSPDGVRVIAPGFSLDARGPLLIDWSLARDPTDPRVTWLQAVAFLDALDGQVDTGVLRAPFAALYPGEPPVTDFELELTRVAR
ncbi:MAG TPA: hypothetical protein VHW65_01835 [Gemmatimonadales bacterium]|jgi:hypothetical protein|nr:hypothetical protein [Gemmatimonadales bacterium]